MKSVKFFVLAICLTASSAGQEPNWCKSLPRPAYSKLERVPITGTWFEVYKIRPGIFAIYEPHQLEEIISYLIVGSGRAPVIRYRHGYQHYCEFTPNDVGDLTSIGRNRGFIDLLRVRHGIDYGGGARR